MAPRNRSNRSRQNRRIALLAGLALSLAGAAGPVHAQEDAAREAPIQFLVPARPVVQPSHQAPVRMSAAEARVTIKDRVAITELAITVTNPGAQIAETQLLLPVPDGSAIKSFKLDSLGDDSAAVLLPAAEARRVYDEIVRKIVDPGLLEFAGLGLIRSSVFPVEPGKTQTFRVAYEQVLGAHGGRVDYVLPRTEALAATGVEWSVMIDIETSSGLGPIISPSHPIETTREGNAARVRVLAPNDPGSFRLSVLHNAGAGGMTVLAYPDARIADGQGGYFMLVGGAPDEWANAETPEREVTLVIDRSGSMRGEKMAQAKEAALQVLQGLNTGERFNIVDYAGTVERFAAEPVVKSAETMEQARAYINSLEANGSTNLHDALVASLRQPTADGSLPLVLFLTDGRATDGVTSEVGIREAARAANAHERRVFTFGVGFDVNAPLLSGLAEATRAAPTFVLPNDSIEVKVSEVFDRLDGPVLVSPSIEGLTALAADFSDRRFIRDVQPRRLPDMYRGDQLVILGKYTSKEQFVMLLHGSAAGIVEDAPMGALGPRQLQIMFNPAEATVANSFVPRLWAQRRIGDLIASIRQAGAEGKQPEQELVDEIVRLSTEHGILTEYTSFLAAEETQFAGRTSVNGMDMDASLALSSRANFELADQAVNTREGAGAVTQDTNNAARKSSTYVQQNSFAVTGGGGGQSPFAGGNQVVEREINTVQRVADQTLFQRGPNRWVDARALTRETDEPEVTIEFGTDAYFDLVTDLATQNRQGLIANRGEILLMNRGQLVLVRNPS
ncbi:MAG: VWA domain-containing protein [Phycisphaerales bacterium]